MQFCVLFHLLSGVNDRLEMAQRWCRPYQVRILPPLSPTTSLFLKLERSGTRVGNVGQEGQKHQGGKERRSQPCSPLDSSVVALGSMALIPLPPDHSGEVYFPTGLVLGLVM